MTKGEAVMAMARANLGPKYLPVCPSAHHEDTCTRPGKAPTIKDWFAKASDDPVVLGEWYKLHPNRNIGMTLGGEFDVDGEHGRQKMDELFEGIIPPTWQFSTRDRRVTKLACCLILPNGPMTASNSIHPTAEYYAWGRAVACVGPFDLPISPDEQRFAHFRHCPPS